ncbi:hypothetical protein AF48_01609 [Klebsiella aerogenes MGH 62]|nr:hypothetical protein AF48_01609 [Klebsiella aerogenes MGH 62]KLW01743.1 hypothetical protein SK43_02252 [Klebsiella aerogenes]VAC89642.1 Uncharacterised protein [Klebsiella aerogenes]
MLGNTGNYHKELPRSSNFMLPDGVCALKH